MEIVIDKSYFKLTPPPSREEIFPDEQEKDIEDLLSDALAEKKEMSLDELEDMINDICDEGNKQESQSGKKEKNQQGKPEKGEGQPGQLQDMPGSETQSSSGEAGDSFAELLKQLQDMAAKPSKTEEIEAEAQIREGQVSEEDNDALKQAEDADDSGEFVYNNSDISKPISTGVDTEKKVGGPKKRWQ